MRPEIRNILPYEKGRIGLIPKALTAVIVTGSAIIASNEDTFADEALVLNQSTIKHQETVPAIEKRATIMVAKQAYTINIGAEPDLSWINLNPKNKPEIIATAQATGDPIKPIRNAYQMLTADQILDIMYTLESSRGVNDGCKDQGKYNGYGYNQSSTVWICYDSFEEVTNIVREWIQNKIDRGFTLGEIFCYYQTGMMTEECTNFEKFKRMGQ